MKTALELLGHVDGPACKCDWCGGLTYGDIMELVAQRAREEMRETASAEVEGPACSDCKHTGCAYERVAARAIRALPVKP
jgi:hypothetical protein